MSGKKTKLKKIQFSSVDMVRRGANQEAYINLYKSAGDPPEQNPPPGAPVAPNPGEIPQGLWKSIVEAVKGFMKTEGAAEEGKKEPGDEGAEHTEGVEKKAESFDDRLIQQEIRDDRWKYQDALSCSIESILADHELSAEEKSNMMHKSIDEFSAAYKTMCDKLLKLTAANKEEPVKTSKSREEIPENSEEGEEEMRIDKSKFSPEELASYEALIAKGRVDDEPETQDGKEGKEGKEEKELEKSAELHPEVKKALAEVEVLRKNMEMKEMRDIAKKYVPLGKKEDELANTLYEMKKSGDASYNAYIAVLDQSLELVNKSGMFEEIGKSGNRSVGYGIVAKSEPEAKIEGIAKSYMEKDPALDYDSAVLKAWENHPELMDAYDAQY